MLNALYVSKFHFIKGLVVKKVIIESQIRYIFNCSAYKTLLLNITIFEVTDIIYEKHFASLSFGRSKNFQLFCYFMVAVMTAQCGEI